MLSLNSGRAVAFSLRYSTARSAPSEPSMLHCSVFLALSKSVCSINEWEEDMSGPEGLIDGMTVSAMARRVAHCVGLRTSSDHGGGGSGLSAGYEAAADMATAAPCVQ